MGSFRLSGSSSPKLAPGGYLSIHVINPAVLGPLVRAGLVDFFLEEPTLAGSERRCAAATVAAL